MLDGAITTETLELWRQDYSILTAERLSNMWTKAIEAGPKGQPILDGLAFEFNAQTLGIFDWLKERGANFVTVCTQEQQDAIAALLTKKMREGHTVDELARMIRPCIGLTESQAKANARYYDSIVANLRKEHPRMKIESIRKKARDAALKYAERQHRERAFTVAQTESAFAYNRGADSGIRQAQAEGYLGTVKKRWSTSGDDGVCEICASMEGMEIDIDAEFGFKGKILFRDHKLLPPAHPRCACAVEYIEVEPSKLFQSGQLYQNAVEGNVSDDPEIQTLYLGSIENMSEDMIKSTLKNYEELFVDSPIENAAIITKDGLIWRCVGSNSKIPISTDLGIDLDGAYVTHNHPIGSPNEYSFSNDDINMFVENSLKLLRGIDEYYVYELTRDPNELDENLSIFDIADYDSRHEIVISKARRLGIGYRRWKR